MSHRRPEPGQALLEQALRRALRLAADSVEPRGDGLERIRSKIAAGPPTPLMATGATGWAGWRARYLPGLLAAFAVVVKYLEAAGIRMRYAFGAVVERFRPDADDTRIVRWLRPAAGLAAAMVVVAGLSFAATTVPTAIIQSTGNSGTPLAGGNSTTSAPSSGNSGGPNGSSGPLGQSGSASPNSSASCKSGQPTSATPTPSPSPSVTSSSTPTSPSPSPSPTDSSTATTPPPTDTPSPTDSATGQASQSPADSSEPASPAVQNGPVPGNTTPTASPHPTASGSNGPCRG